MRKSNHTLSHNPIDTLMEARVAHCSQPSKSEPLKVPPIPSGSYLALGYLATLAGGDGHKAHRETARSRWDAARQSHVVVGTWSPDGYVPGRYRRGPKHHRILHDERGGPNTI